MDTFGDVILGPQLLQVQGQLARTGALDPGAE
jgi:hypothetical protein